MNHSVVSEGNKTRIANAMKKAQRGQPVTVGFIGGSITEGACATPYTNRYANLVFNWWVEQFPNSQITFVNAGIGATNSIIGVHRVEKDLLDTRPDFVVVEFSVNDSSGTLYQTAYENLVRRILLSSKEPGVLLLFMTTNAKVSQQEPHKAVGLFYDLPMISYKDAVWDEIDNGGLKWEDVGADYIHPNNFGHRIAAELVNNYLEGVLNELNEITEQIVPLPEGYVTSSLYKNGVIYDNTEITPTSLGDFSVDNTAFPRHFSNGWTAVGGTAPLVFEVKEARVINILYKRSVNGQTCSARVTATGNDGEMTQTLDGDFTGGFGDYATMGQVWSSDRREDVQISIGLQADGAKNQFTVLGIMVS